MSSGRVEDPAREAVGRDVVEHEHEDVVVGAQTNHVGLKTGPFSRSKRARLVVQDPLRLRLAGRRWRERSGRPDVDLDGELGAITCIGRRR